MQRRDLLKLFSAAALSGPLQISAAEPGAPLYFTKDEFDLLDKLTDLIIPTDSHSPGAHAAGVAVFIDKTVAEAFLPEDKASWRKGLAAINHLSHSTSGKLFLETTESQQIALLTKLAAKEKKPKTEPEKFFTQLKESTAFAYYSSSIGIHQDMEYKGNVILQEFSGFDAV
jgi:Gluconate 2-dehydrogenase subunit 3